MMGNRGFLPKQESRAEARSLRLKALALDDSSGEVHTSLGFTFLYFEDDFETAGIEIRRGLALLPDDGEAHRVHGAWLKIAGQLEQAREQMLMAVALNPQAPVSHSGLSDVLMALGRNAEAVTPLGTALKLSPTYQGALERLDMCCHRAGWFDQALDARRTLLGMRGLHERAAALQEATRTDGWPVARERDVRSELDALLARAAQEDPFDRVRHPQSGRFDRGRTCRAGRVVEGHGLGGARLLPASRASSPRADRPPLRPSRSGVRPPLRAAAENGRVGRADLVERVQTAR